MLTRLLFERVFLLFIILVPPNLITFVFWSRRRTTAWRNALVTGITMTCTLLTLNVVVATPREQTWEVCRQLATAVDKGEAAEVGSLLAFDFEADGLGRGEFIDALQEVLVRYRIDNPRMFNVQSIQPEQGVIVVEFNAFGTVLPADGEALTLNSRWRLTLTLQDDQWAISRIESIPVPPLNIERIQQILRATGP